MKGSRWGLGKGLQTPRTAHVLPCHVTKEKKKKLKFFFAYQNAFLNSMESFFFSLSVTRKLYRKSADQTLRRFESGNKAQGCTMCLNVTKKNTYYRLSVVQSVSTLSSILRFVAIPGIGTYIKGSSNYVTEYLDQKKRAVRRAYEAGKQKRKI